MILAKVAYAEVVRGMEINLYGHFVSLACNTPPCFVSELRVLMLLSYASHTIKMCCFSGSGVLETRLVHNPFVVDFPLIAIASQSDTQV